MPFSSDVANCLLWTPFDNKSINRYNLHSKLTEDIFLNQCFSEPCFKNSVNYVLDDINTDDNDVSFTVDEIHQALKEEKSKYKNFMNWLDTFENHKVYTLSGNSGTGKTTFLHKLKQISSEYVWTIIDVSIAPDKFDWLGDISTKVSNYDQAFRKTFSAVLNEIHRIIFDEKSESENKLNIIHNNLLNIVSKYNQIFKNKYIAGCSLYNKLSTIFGCKDCDNTERVVRSAEVFQDYFKNTPSDDDRELLDNALDILMIALRCLDSDINTRHIIAFDNFERFLSQDEIYNDEINQIRQALATNDLRVNKNCNHDLKFKFIMAIRCSTARICGVRLQQADEKESNLDISSWFSMEDIIRLKMDWFRENNIKDDNFNLTKQITGDLRKCKNGDATGLKLFLDPLFNDNKRLMVDFFGIILEGKDNKEKYNYTTYVEDYRKNWDIDTSLTRCAARNIIKGLVLYKLKHIDDLFKNLKSVSENPINKEPDIGTGLARKMLTLIYNKTITEREEILLSDIIEELYASRNISVDWYTDEFASKRRSISQIIFHMISYNRRNNDWIQFIELQHEDTKNKIKIKTAFDMEKILRNDLEKFHVSIMPAGVAYLTYIAPSFEFFSVRYCKNYKPLFSSIPDVSIMENNINVKNLECYKIVETVKNVPSVAYAKFEITI